MPRRDWNAKLDREYERLYEQQARAGAARLGPSVRCDPSPTCVRDGHGPWGPAAPPDQTALLPRAAPPFASEPNASFGQMTVVTSR